MFKLNETSLEWALKHLRHFSSSSFYPKAFEFDAIAHNWKEVKKYISDLDLDEYTPKTPLISLALKPNKNFRVVHQLDPIDSIIYTALIYEIQAIIEDYRIPKSEKISCSYRINADTDGSFFNDLDCYDNYKEKTEELAAKHSEGYILICDVTDFYNQIYAHRIRNIISEAGGRDFEEHARIIEKFILGLNSKTSRGIPVGPNPSIVLAEAIMADIDKKILSYTRDFTRYVDDIRIFFTDESAALKVLHELTRYLYTSHRLVFSGVKTKIEKVDYFLKNTYLNEEKEEAIAIASKQEEITFDKIESLHEKVFSWDNLYGESPEIDEATFEKIYKEVGKTEEFKILADTYCDLFQKEIDKEKIDNGLLKHILWRVINCRMRCLIPIIFENFEKVTPFAKEISIYLSRVLNKKAVEHNKEAIKKIISNEYCKLPYINTWLSHLLQQKNFGDIELAPDDILQIRDKALIARERKDTTFIKDHKNNLDVLAPWDKRAVIFSSIILSKDEISSWLALIQSKDDIIDRSLASYVLSLKKSES